MTAEYADVVAPRVGYWVDSGLSPRLPPFCRSSAPPVYASRSFVSARLPRIGARVAAVARSLRVSVLVVCAFVGAGLGCSTVDVDSDAGPSGGLAPTRATLYATAGDAATTLDVAELVPNATAYRLHDAPASATLDGSTLTVRHEAPVNEHLRLEADTPDGPRGVGIRHVVRAATLDAVRYPLRVRDDGRGLVDAGGRSVQWNGDTPWSLVVQLAREDVTAYLDDRTRIGVNALLFNAIEHKFGDANPHPWTNRDGEDPFVQTLPGGAFDFTTPNEAYWQTVDWILGEAYRRGMTCLFVPAYLGWKHGDEGWAADVDANGTDRMRAYGEWIGTRYRTAPHLVWVMGGDWGPVSDAFDLTAEVNALAAGLTAATGDPLMTAHDGLRSAVDGYDQPWLDLNNTYAYQADVPGAVQRDRERPGPFFFLEGRYENSPGLTPRDVRAQTYQALLGGAFGHFYGAHNLWSFDAPPGEGFAATPSDTWRDALGYPAGRDLAVTRALLDVRDVSTLRPDAPRALLVDGGGSASDASYAPCGVAPDRRSAVCYTPESRPLSLDLAQLSGPIRATWLHPSTGATTDAGTFDAGGSTTLTPPAPDGAGDWLLLLDDATLDAPLPRTPSPRRTSL